jgi:hypothetical protein
MPPMQSDRLNENAMGARSRNRSQSEDQQIAEVRRSLHLVQSSLESLSCSLLSMRKLARELACGPRSCTSPHPELSEASRLEVYVHVELGPK